MNNFSCLVPLLLKSPSYFIWSSSIQVVKLNRANDVDKVNYFKWCSSSDVVQVEVEVVKWSSMNDVIRSLTPTLFDLRLDLIE